jgi:hypothetical protein
MMKKVLYLTLAVVLLSLVGSDVFAATGTATQTVTYASNAITVISVSGNPAALTVNAAVAGSDPTAVSDSTTTYAVTTNESSKKITAGLDTAMPAGLTLTLNLVAPAGATSAGATALSNTAVSLVTGISTLKAGPLAVTYQLSATAAAGVVTSASKTVTLTLTT